jgi:hypothetical protein
MFTAIIGLKITIHRRLQEAQNGLFGFFASLLQVIIYNHPVEGIFK